MSRTGESHVELAMCWAQVVVAWASPTTTSNCPSSADSTPCETAIQEFEKGHPLDKRYQVFVSSTYVDLREERSKVMQQLLEMNCIPAGMELFPAADDDAWTLIKNVIDECDYYLLILAGRYGSTDEHGMGFTEKECRYAIETGKPVIAFIHSSPNQLAFDKSEPNEEGRAKLEAFRELARQKHCKYWSNVGDLASAVTVSMVHMINRHPGVGWIRADQLPAEDILTETIRLQKRVREMETLLNEYEGGSPPGAALLAQGADRVRLFVTLNWKGGDENPQPEVVPIETDWDSILDCIARVLLTAPTETQICETLASMLREKCDRTRANDEQSPSLVLASESRDAIRIQFRALGIAVQTSETITGRDGMPRYRVCRWNLTSFGDRCVAQRLAIRRSSPH